MKTLIHFILKKYKYNQCQDLFFVFIIYRTRFVSKIREDTFLGRMLKVTAVVRPSFKS